MNITISYICVCAQVSKIIAIKLLNLTINYKIYMTYNTYISINHSKTAEIYSKHNVEKK